MLFQCVCNDLTCSLNLHRYILPGLFYLKLHRDKKWDCTKIAAAFLFGFGCFVFLFCFGGNIYGFIAPS